MDDIYLQYFHIARSLFSLSREVNFRLKLFVWVSSFILAYFFRAILYIVILRTTLDCG